MWPDNETPVDLLGFDYLVDSLEYVVTNDRLKPVTIGVLGDWGSGKSSLLQMLAERLASRTDYVVVSFSPWRSEGYEDAKASLMAAILRQLHDRIEVGDNSARRLFNRLWVKVRALIPGPAAAVRAVAKPVGSAIAVAHGAPPEVGAVAAEAVVIGVDAAVASQTALEHPQSFDSVSDFRDEFGALLGEIKGLTGVCVLIDDLDRCLPDTIVDVFEAIRLFLHAPRTAFVIAAHREIVQAAIEGRYPINQQGDASLGRDYLEKIVQIEVNVPALAGPEAETYLNLLFAELRLDANALRLVLDEAAKRRHAGAIAVCMNHGIAAGVLGTVSAELQSDFTIVSRIAPALSRGLRGNPRQLKRFLNTLMLRVETARRRSVGLLPDVMAKLMVLELSANDFQQLYRWQLDQNGKPTELAEAELARIPENLGAKSGTDVRNWMQSPAVRAWLELEPPLAMVALGPYFFYSRDRLAPGASAARLSTKLQGLLARLGDSIAAKRRSAVKEAANLSAEELGPLIEVLIVVASRTPGEAVMDSVIEIAGQRKEYWPVVCQNLAKIPAVSVPVALPPKLMVQARDDPSVHGLLDQWQGSTVSRLAASVGQARKLSKK
jgi:KAP family P-loop domain